VELSALQGLYALAVQQISALVLQLEVSTVQQVQQSIQLLQMDINHAHQVELAQE